MRDETDERGPGTSRLFSRRAATLFAISAALTFSAAGSAPTPLYHLYQETMNLSPFMLTVIFAAYVVSLLAALLTVGSLSDYVGRRPVIFAALVLNALAMVIFFEAGSPGVLIAARVVQGFATGAATTSLSAAILDNDPAKGPIWNSITAFCGLTLGALGAAALVEFAPTPDKLVYLVIFIVTACQILLLRLLPESAVARPGALLSLRPHFNIQPHIRATFSRVMPVNLAAWTLGGFYFSLMPTLLRVATGSSSPFVGGVVVAALTLTGAIAVVLTRSWAARVVLLVGSAFLIVGVSATLVGVYLQSASVILFSTVVAGIGFGSAFAGTLRSILPLSGASDRAGLLSTFYVGSYLAFCVPAIMAGLAAPQIGLTVTVYIYGAIVIGLAVSSLVATMLERLRPA